MNISKNLRFAINVPIEEIPYCYKFSFAYHKKTDDLGIEIYLKQPTMFKKIDNYIYFIAPHNLLVKFKDNYSIQDTFSNNDGSVIHIIKCYDLYIGSAHFHADYHESIDNILYD